MLKMDPFKMKAEDRIQTMQMTLAALEAEKDSVVDKYNRRIRALRSSIKAAEKAAAKTKSKTTKATSKSKKSKASSASKKAKSTDA